MTAAAPDLPILSDGVVRLRPFAAKDAAVLATIWLDPSIRARNTIPEPSQAAAADWVAGHAARVATGQTWEWAIVDAATDRLAGRRWVQTGGTDYGCMPEAAVTEGGPLVDVRCRWGATTLAERAGNKLIVKNASLAIEGFNPATGVATWTVSLADPTGQSEEAVFNRIEVVGEHTLLVPTAHGEMLIDPTTGATRLAPADTAAVCLVAIQVPLAGGQRTVAGTTTNNYVTGHQAIRCTGPGTPAATATTAWPSWVGSTVNHVHVVTTDTGLQGYRQ